MNNALSPTLPPGKVRRERKYLVNQEELSVFFARMKGLLQVDRHDTDASGYFNHSIYFDSPGYDHYVDKREGISIRSKPRLRTYRASIDGPPVACFLEFKNRLNEVNWKERQRIDDTSAQGLIDGVAFDDEAASHSGDLVTKFHLHCRQFALSPAATVLYHRMAFTCDLEPSLRITFDRRIMGALGARQKGGPEGFQFVLSPEMSILEIKYDFGYPEWLLRITTDLELDLLSISKYGLALESLFAGYATRSALSR
jgi:hypothetical protein